tara:strand:+ start:939 stop:1451 length:513 start_codon:yes stop_codon:yes gene_type:complete
MGKHDKHMNYFHIDLDYNINELKKVVSHGPWKVFNQGGYRFPCIQEMRLEYGYNYINDLSFLKNVPFDFKPNHVMFTKILPRVGPFVHRDFNRKCALTIPISNCEPINFYNDKQELEELVTYSKPTVINLEHLHAVKNSTDEERIIFQISLYQPIQELKNVYNKISTISA